MSYEFNKYACTTDTLKATLDTFGVAIIPSVLTSEECEKMVSGFWDFFEHITQHWKVPLRRDNTTTWREFYKLLPLHSMLIQHFDVGHIQALWDIRQNPNIVNIFADFWKCTPEELLVSFDGLSFHLPPEETQRGWNKNNTWYHTDQSYTTSEFQCIQSFVTGLDIEDHDATLSIYEGSHRLHHAFQQQYQSKDKKDWYKLSKEQEAFYGACSIKHIKCPKGSLVLWDSRTIHCGIEAYRERLHPKLRAVGYVCYMPRNMATEAQLSKKKKAFEELRTMTHHPCKGKLFGKSPRTYGNIIEDVDRVDRPVVTELGLKLAGF